MLILVIATSLACLAAMAGLAFVTLRFRERERQLDEERHARANEESRADRLGEIDRLKDEFLATTSHEIRAPLYGIIGIADSLIDGAAGVLNERQIHDLSMITASGRRLAHLINDIQDFSKLKHHGIQLNKSAMDLYSAVNVTLQLSRHLLGDKTIELKNNIDEDLPPAHADENRVQQILQNLIGNAIKFTETGSVTLTARSIPAQAGPGEAESNARPVEQLEVSVRDTGIGIPADRHESIFESFDRVEDAGSASGSGLGLTVTKQLIELHGGTIQVESVPGKGSDFRFTLPMSGDEARASEVDQAELLNRVREEAGEHVPDATQPEGPAAGLSRARILVIDDEPISQQLLSNQLTVMGYSVRGVASGKEALELLEQDDRFDAVLSDVMMTGLNGFDICREIRKQHPPDLLPVLLVTGKNQISDLEEGLRMGANDFLTKPLSRGELFARLEMHLNLARLSDAARRWVPDRLLGLLGHEHIGEVEPGDQTQRDMTVLFAGIRSFQTQSRTMSPRENFEFINRFLARVDPVITRNNGLIVKFHADAVLGLFPDSPDEAHLAGVEMLREIDKFNETRKRSGQPPIRIGVGIHHGPVMLGTIGDHEHIESAVFSDAVNLTMRLERMTDEYGTNLILSDTLIKTLKKKPNTRRLGRIMVRGRSFMETIHEGLDGLAPDIARARKHSRHDFESGLDRYIAGDYASARKSFSKVLEKDDTDRAARYYSDKTSS